MKNSTVEFLCETHLAVIACEDDSLLQDFVKYVCAEYGASVVEHAADEIGRCGLSGAEIVIVNGLRNSREQRPPIVRKLGEIRDVAKAADVHAVVALEGCNVEGRTVTSQLRCILFRFPESEKPQINMFVLRRGDAYVKLECEFGTVAGCYLLYDYGEHTFRLKENI